MIDAKKNNIFFINYKSLETLESNGCAKVDNLAQWIIVSSAAGIFRVIVFHVWRNGQQIISVDIETQTFNLDFAGQSIW